jgi:CRP/FNR family transcriptional regulator
MHTVARSDEMANPPSVVREGSGIAAASGADRQIVSTGQVLFQPGEARRHYRVEEGAIFHYVRWTDGSHDLIEVAFPGDIVGLGYLEHHISTAQAMVDSSVSVVTEDEIASLLDVDDRLPLLLASAGEREFDYMRDVTVNSGKRSPVERLANYLLAVAEDGAIVADDLTSGYVAERLQMNLDTLSNALVGLQHKGLVKASEGGLRITDAAELERVANAA